MTLREFQDLIRAMYHEKDATRGVEGTFMWLTEEIGELATALRSGTHEEQALEFADVLAWLVTIANDGALERNVQNTLTLVASGACVVSGWSDSWQINHSISSNILFVDKFDNEM
jgi:NTP pyrophosphatase (non-canonical NTP hydrolase)